jgi:hypothetical protein
MKPLAAALALIMLAAGMSAAAARSCRAPRPDSAVFGIGIGIGLGDSESARRIVGDDYRYFGHEPETDYPWAHFMSRDGRQMLSLRHHAGDVVHSHMEFSVRYAGASTVEQSLATDAFVTDRGIRLGVGRRFLRARIGSCFKTVMTGAATETVRYEITDARSPLLERHNMPRYYAEYEFRNGRLVRFQFGFDPV